MPRDTDRLYRHMGPFEQKLTSRLRQELQSEFRQWCNRRSAEQQSRSWFAWRHDTKPTHERRLHNELRPWLDFLVAWIPARLEELRDLQTGHVAFQRTCLLAGEDHTDQLVLDYARELGHRTRWDLEVAATRRWFGVAAVTQRYRRRCGEIEQSIEFALRQLGELLSDLISVVNDQANLPEIWQRVRMSRVSLQVLQHSGDVRIKRALFDALSRVFQATPTPVVQQLIDAEFRDLAQGYADNPREDTWLQVAAIRFLARVDPEATLALSLRRLAECLDGDDLFVRRKLVSIVSVLSPQASAISQLIDTVLYDPSPFVRQQLAQEAWTFSDELRTSCLTRLMQGDEDPKVRAAAIASILTIMDSPAYSHNRVQAVVSILSAIAQVLWNEHDPFVLRTTLHVCGELTMQFTDDRDTSTRNGALEDWSDFTRGMRAEVLPAIRWLQRQAPTIAVRRWAACAAESIWVRLDDEANRVWFHVRHLVQLSPSRGVWLPRRDKTCDETDELRLVGRVLAVLAQYDYGFDVHVGRRGYWITRGPRFWSRGWRILHEWRHPSTDKRQAHRHTVGRHSAATLRIPSGVMAEMSPTEVPGEPRFLVEEQGWRSFLPLLDDFLSVLGISWHRPRTVEFVTACGVTTVSPPRSLAQRMRAWWHISRSFATLAELRNIKERSEAASYLRALRKLGFEIRFIPHSDSLAGTAEAARRNTSTREISQHLPDMSHAPRATTATTFEDNSVLQFFPSFAVLGMLAPGQFSDAFRQFVVYCHAIYENSLTHLLLFTTTLMLLIVLKHAWSNIRLRHARRRVAISIGGWGTRGKSGTERLKAALISSLGYSLVSKTTGCEAMVLRSDPFGPTRELPLYRARDKATIWEQTLAMRMASAAKSDVFLWECMGLNPEYVDILQRQWTRDDVSTITNTHPDHENLQGPAGWNVADAIARFIPNRSHLVTSERQMLPVLRHACRQAGTTCHSVGWLATGLLPDEIINRFPYQEHPDNIALVAGLAEDLGVDADFALKAMADHVVADLGVLRTFPTATVGVRRLQFTNAMSANERFACLESWNRSGFGDHDPLQHPNEWISTIINNRKDRVSRSRVFAAIVVDDLRADRHFLIGSNLGGFMQFVTELWETRVQAYSPWHDCDTTAIDSWHAIARSLRLPDSEQELVERIVAMVRGLTLVPLSQASAPGRRLVDEQQVRRAAFSDQQLRELLLRSHIDGELVSAVVAQQTTWVNVFHRFEGLRQQIAMAETRSPEIESECRALVTEWFLAKFVVIDDENVSGDEMIAVLVANTPPGFLHRLMGIQNIKGPGLRLIEQWQNWEQVQEACRQIQEGRTNSSHGVPIDTRKLGLLAEDSVAQTIETWKLQANAQQLLAIRQWDDALRTATARRHETNASGENRTLPPLVTTLLGWIEDVVDPWDSIRRRWQADRVYRDLGRDQICYDDAIAELRKVNSREQGGWLCAMVEQWWAWSTASDDAPSGCQAEVSVTCAATPSNGLPPKRESTAFRAAEEAF